VAGLAAAASDAYVARHWLATFAVLASLDVTSA
jgi:hypothetical protein